MYLIRKIGNYWYVENLEVTLEHPFRGFWGPFTEREALQHLSFIRRTA